MISNAKAPGQNSKLVKSKLEIVYYILFPQKSLNALCLWNDI